jgi:enoyl-CoA hydratase/carnithine racemase
MHIILNKPKRSNGLTGGMYILIGDYLYEASNNIEIKAVILRGNGKNFCSGNDLSNFAGLAD